MSDKPQDGASGPQITGSWDIPEPTPKSLFSVKYHRLVVKRINALLKMVAIPSRSNQPLIISDGNAHLPVAGSPTIVNGGGGNTTGSGGTVYL